MLDDPEQFVLIVYPLEGLRSKLETWSFILAFDEDAEILLRSMDCLSSALSELMNSSELRIIFGIILSIGNYLNGGTIRGQADGFEVDALRLLSSIKSLDRGFSLLDFIVSVYEMELEHHRSELSSQLSWISEAYSGMSLFDISSKCRALLHGYRPVSLLPISCSETDLFIVQVEKFLDRSIPVITQLGESLEECLSAYQLALNYFCCTNLSPEGKESKEFLHIFTQFVDQVMNSQSLSSLYEFRISTLKIPSPLSRRSSRVEDIYYKSQNSRKSSLSNYYDRVRIPRRFSLPPPRHRRSASDASEEILSLACHLNISPVRCRSKHSRAPMNSSELQGT